MRAFLVISDAYLKLKLTLRTPTDLFVPYWLTGFSPVKIKENTRCFKHVEIIFVRFFFAQFDHKRAKRKAFYSSTSSMEKKTTPY